MNTDFLGCLHYWEELTRSTVVADPPPKKMVLSTTVPKDFHFNTDSRVKASTSSNTDKEVDFASQLRKPSSPVSVPTGILNLL